MKKSSKKSGTGRVIDTYEGVKPRNPYAVLAKQKTGAGKHANKGMRGSGKHSGQRHAKHKKGLKNPGPVGDEVSTYPDVCAYCRADVRVSPFSRGPFFCCAVCQTKYLAQQRKDSWESMDERIRRLESDPEHQEAVRRWLESDELLKSLAYNNPPNVVSATAGLAGAALIGAGFLWFGWLSPKLGLAREADGTQSKLNARLAAGLVVGFMGLWVVAVSSARR